MNKHVLKIRALPHFSNEIRWPDFGIKIAIWAAAQILVVCPSFLMAETIDETAENSAPDVAQATIVDISKWRCRFCEEEEGWSTHFTVGFGYVFEGANAFGEYNGLEDVGDFIGLSGKVKSRGELANYLDADFTDLGLDSYDAAVSWGQQGRRDAYVAVKKITRYDSNPVRTPYLGTSVQTLPPDWITAGSTQDFAALDENSQEVDIKTERNNIEAGIEFRTDSPWRYHLAFRRNEKQGKKRSGGTFYFHAVQFVEPIDFNTNEIDAAVFYSQRHWQLSLAYYASLFTNDTKSLRWENPFDSVVQGAGEGLLALPPDNKHQQITLTGNYILSPKTNLNGFFALGVLTQDDQLLPTSINTHLQSPALPAEFFDGDVKTTNANLRYRSAFSEKLMLGANLFYDARDNQSPSLAYTPITTDVFVAPRQYNRPYGYKRTAFDFSADYAATRDARFELGAKRISNKRDYAQTDQTDEDILWGSARLRGSDVLSVDLRLEASMRDATGRSDDTNLYPAENILLTKFNLAHRQRRVFSVDTNIVPSQNISIGISADLARDDYTRSVIGLEKSRDNSLNIDVSAMLASETRITVFGGQQSIASSHRGSQEFSYPDWVTDIHDRFYFLGVGMSRPLFSEKIDIEVDYSVSRSIGQIVIQDSADFPDIQSNNAAIALELTYHHTEKTRFKAMYLHEEYRLDDWAIAGLTPTTVPNYLAFGEQNPAYNVDVILISINLSL